MLQSILDNTKKLLTIPESETHFDVDIITYINTTIMTLEQLGLASAKGFMVTDSKAVWADLCGEHDPASIASYIYLKTRIVFDPPTSSFVLTALTDSIKELEWRLTLQFDTSSISSPGGDTDGCELLI